VDSGQAVNYSYSYTDSIRERIDSYTRITGVRPIVPGVPAWGHYSSHSIIKFKITNVHMYGLYL